MTYWLRARAAMVALLLGSSASAIAQGQPSAAQQAEEAAAKDGPYPAGIQITASPKGEAFPTGQIHVTSSGQTLYAISMRLARARSGEGLKYCVGPCATIWRPYTTAANTTPVGHWTVVEGAEGPQWAYKGNPVFTYVEDKAPGQAGGQGYQDLFRVIQYIPARPKLTAPQPVAVAFHDGRYLLVEGSTHLLYVTDRPCADECPSDRPLAAGLSSQPVGGWSIVTVQDRQQWSYQGKPVFISAATRPSDLRADQRPLQP